MIRLFTDQPLQPDGQAPLTTAQANYLHNVMRQRVGTEILIFNGQQGEWLARIESLGKKNGTLVCVSQTKPQAIPADIHLLFAPLKKIRTDFLIEKACELGCARISPVFTRHTNAERVRSDRLRALMIESAEQCGNTHIPILDAPQPLQTLLNTWNPARSLLFCDERQTGKSVKTTLEDETNTSWAILIGPEGGFSSEEAQRLEKAPYAYPVTLGPRILRAETAAISALTAWQMIKGDWAF